MNLDLILLHNPSTGQELGNILALITLKLNDLAKLFVLNNVAVAAELFLEIFEDLLVAEFLPQPLHGGQAFLSIPLLDAYMNILFSSWGTRILGLGEWIKSTWNLDV